MIGKAKNIRLVSEHNSESYFEPFRDSIADQIEDNFIFYGNRRFTEQIEIYVIPKSNPNRKKLKVIHLNSDLMQLREIIALELNQFPEYANLGGFKVVNLTKNTEEKKGTTLPESGKVKDYIKTGDLIYYDIIADEYWIKAIFRLDSEVMKKYIKVSIKIKKDITKKKFKIILLKCGINYFFKEISKIKVNPEKAVFIIVCIEYRFTGQGKFNFDENGDNDENINQFLDFNSEITIYIKFVILQKKIFERMKQYQLNDTYFNNLRFKEFKELEFDELMSSFKFKPERNLILTLSSNIVRYPILNYDSPFFILENTINSNELFSLETENELPLNDDISENHESYIRKNILLCPFSVNEFKLIGRHKRIKSIGEMDSKLNYSFISTNKKIVRKKRTSLNYRNNIDNKSNDDDIEENLIADDLNDRTESMDLTFKTKEYNSFLGFEEIERPSVFESVRESSKFANLCMGFQTKFSIEQFFEELPLRSKFEISKKIMVDCQCPEFKDNEVIKESEIDNYDEIISDNFWDDKQAKILIYSNKTILFFFLIVLYFIVLLVAINLDVISYLLL